MKKIAEKKGPTADEIAEMAMNGEDISSYFTNDGKMHPPLKSVAIDFPEEMLNELDAIAGELSISRQAVIKLYLRQAMDQHYLASEMKSGASK